MSGRGMDLMMGWDRGWDVDHQDWVDDGLMYGLDWDASKLWASVGRGLAGCGLDQMVHHFVYSDLTITNYSQFSQNRF